MSNNDITQALDVLSGISRAKTSQEAIEQLLSFSRPWGFDRYLIAHVTSPNQPGPSRNMLHTNYPEELITPRFEEQKLTYDPVVQYAMRSSAPFTWQEAYKFATRYGMKFIEPARDFRMNDGYMVPMRRPGRPDGALSLGAEQYELPDETAYQLHMICTHTYYKLDELHKPPTAHTYRKLSQRETDVLQYAAAGKTLLDISEILDISEAASKATMRRVHTKLDAVNTPQAVAIAIAQGLIFP